MNPFTIDVPQSAIDDLHRRLDATRWPTETPDVGWSRGVPLPYLRELADHWRHDYDWRRTEAAINRFSQLKVDVGGAHLHVLHVRSPEPDATPMMMTTGWPSSVVEYLDLIGPLTDPRAHGGNPEDAFHLVIPTLPGFGFSTPLTEHGWTVPRMSEVLGSLMARLGYDRYVVQGADWGSFISLILAAMSPDTVIGAHVNFLVTPPTGPEALLGLPAEEAALIDDYMTPSPGYMTQHATRPQTLSYSLNDSPVGLLAWYVEKFHAWSGAQERLEEVFDRDAILANASLYWLTGTAGNAAHFYCDNAPFTRSQATPHPEIANALDQYAAYRTLVHPLPPVQVPVGVASYPHDIMQPLRSFAEQAFTDIVHWTTPARGGHFPGLEAPDLFLEDIRAFKRALVSKAVPV